MRHLLRHVVFPAIANCGDIAEYKTNAVRCSCDDFIEFSEAEFIVVLDRLHFRVIADNAPRALKRIVIIMHAAETFEDFVVQIECVACEFKQVERMMLQLPRLGFIAVRDEQVKSVGSGGSFLVVCFNLLLVFVCVRLVCLF